MARYNDTSDLKPETKNTSKKTSMKPLCIKCDSIIDNSKDNNMNANSNEVVTDAVPRTAQSDYDEEEEKIIRMRQQLNLFNAEREKRKIDNALRKASTSFSTHLEDFLKQGTDSRQKTGTLNKTEYNINDVFSKGSRVLFENRRALSADADTYELETFADNIMIIFNHYRLDSYTKPREGTFKDVEALENTFSKFNFRFIVHDDLNKTEILSELDKFSQIDFSDYGCVSVVVLTHGSDNGLLYAKDVTYNESEILERFETHKNPSLATKPKLFIFQACRGTSLSKSIDIRPRTIQHDGGDENDYTLPMECDVLSLHSTYPGNAAHRETEHGSWMIQKLCTKIDELAAKEDLLSIVTRVQKDVAIDKQNVRYDKRTSSHRIDKQMPILTSTLIRKLELYKNSPKSKQTETVNVVDGIYTDYVEMIRSYNRQDLDYFDYIKNCTACFTEETENYNDNVAQAFLTVADTFGNNELFDNAKMAMANAMTDHLASNITKKEPYKYIYLRKYRF